MMPKSFPGVCLRRVIWSIRIQKQSMNYDGLMLDSPLWDPQRDTAFYANFVWGNRHSYKQIANQTNRQTDRQTGRQTERQTDKLAVTETLSLWSLSRLYMHIIRKWLYMFMQYPGNSKLFGIFDIDWHCTTHELWKHHD